MTKKSLARQQRDRLKKENMNAEKISSTLWTDVKNVSAMCWGMLGQNKLLLETLKSDLQKYIPQEEIGTLNSSLATLTSDLIRFKTTLEAIDAKHHDRVDSTEPITDSQEIYSMFALAVECQSEYQQFTEQYNAVVMPVASRIIEIIAMAEDRYSAEFAANSVDISAVKMQQDVEDAVIVETTATSNTVH